MPVYRDDSELPSEISYDETIAYSMIVLVHAQNLHDQADWLEHLLRDVHGFSCLNHDMEENGILESLREIDPDITAILAESEKAGNEFAQRLLSILPKPLAIAICAPDIKDNWCYSDERWKLICAKTPCPPDQIVFVNALIRLVRFAHQFL